MVTSLLTLAVVLVFMVGELALSRRNERLLLARGAVEAVDPVYVTMRWTYPGAFVAMAVEGIITRPEFGVVTIAGLAVFVAAKLLKYWAITTLGERWTYRVLVLPGAPLIARGPYRLVRHPNYVGVVGELAGAGLLTGARWSGPLAVLFFSWLLVRRITAEERALGLR
jgi:methyltransferase